MRFHYIMSKNSWPLSENRMWIHLSYLKSRYLVKQNELIFDY